MAFPLYVKGTLVEDSTAVYEILYWKIYNGQEFYEVIQRSAKVDHVRSRYLPFFILASSLQEVKSSEK